MINIFTDGSSRGNPGPGGWAAVIVIGKKVIELGGGEKNTTNNRMEIMAAIRGLRKALESFEKLRNHSEKVEVFTDSSYVINGITKWITGWKRNGWQTKTKEDVLNKDLWMELDEAVTDVESSGGAKVSWKYVGGHVGVLGNERCDHIATSFADGMKIKLYDGPLADYDLPKVLDILLDETKQTKKSSDSAHSRAKAYSYVSMVDGIIETHHSWAECEKRVKGVRGAKYKKAVSADNEQQIMAEFEAV